MAIDDELRGHIEAVVDYNWQSELRDAKENGLEGHVMNHLLALADFLGWDTAAERNEIALASVDPDFGEGDTNTEEDERFRQKVEEENGCGEHADGLVGIHWPTKADNTDPPEGWSWVERCDACDLFEDDEAAARALIVKLGVPATEVAWFDRYSHEPVPGNQYVMGASVAIKIPERVYELQREIEEARRLGRDPQRQLCELADLTDDGWSWDKNDDVWERPCPECGAGPLDLKGHGAVCPNGHILEGE